MAGKGKTCLHITVCINNNDLDLDFFFRCFTQEIAGHTYLVRACLAYCTSSKLSILDDLSKDLHTICITVGSTPNAGSLMVEWLYACYLTLPPSTKRALTRCDTSSSA